MSFAKTDSGIWIPSHMKPARKFIAVVFWHSKKLNRIVVGLPEEYPVPKILRDQGFEKQVCRSAHEVELWSQKLRDQESRDAEMTAEQREAVEGPIRDACRKELLHKMTTSKNQLNRDFCRYALQKMDEQDEKRKAAKRESYMHQEAAEEGH